MSDLVLTFGRYAGKKLSEITDRSYIQWIAGLKTCKQDDAPEAARTFLSEHPDMNPQQPRRSQQPGPAPRTYREASKLGWMAGKGYGNARATMLAARDQDGFLQVIDEEDYLRLLYVYEDGSITDAAAGFSALSSAQVESILARYPHVDKGDYLADVADREEMEADQARRTLEMKSLNGKHTITLCIWDKRTIEVSIDGRDQGTYLFRELTEQERSDPFWQNAAGILEPNEEDPWGQPGSRLIGLTLERRSLIEQKLKEVASDNGRGEH